MSHFRLPAIAILPFLALAAFSALLAMPASAQSAASQDARFVGRFQGQRSTSGKCRFLAWDMTRSADGRFAVTFYNDPRKTHVKNRESGSWWSKGNLIYLKTDGIQTPDAYSFRFRDADTIEMSAVKRDKRADCQADYHFFDHRVRPGIGV
ncbi:MAG: hypothetical protein FWD68_18560 [Alphaproteobacteria bacterium]|nr:hypothetical protein [Alphaproteobacteria bacterium]